MRHSQHLSATRAGLHTYLGRWILSLRKDGLKPEIFEIEVVKDGWEEAEDYWINYFRYIGARLVNTAAGGGLYPGYKKDPVTIARHKETLKRVGVSEKQRLAISNLHERFRNDPDFYARWKEKQQAAIKTPEYRRKMAEIVRGRKMPQSAIEKSRARHIGRRNTPEQLARISAGAYEREARKRAKRLAAQSCPNQ